MAGVGKKSVKAPLKSHLIIKVGRSEVITLGSRGIGIIVFSQTDRGVGNKNFFKKPMVSFISLKHRKLKNILLYLFVKLW